MSKKYSPSCQRCFHPQDRHAKGSGKCCAKNSKIDRTLCGPDGSCFCDKFVRGKTRAENLREFNRTVNAANWSAYSRP